MDNSNKSVVSRRSFLMNAISVPCLIGLSAIPRVFALTDHQSKRPFEMLALGDSVIWGQGLSYDNKFSVLVKKWLEKTKFSENRLVNLHYEEAHSGATICPELPRKPRPRYHGEINVYSPSIVEQVERAAAYYARRETNDGPLATGNVDLILIDGGINDMRAGSIVLKEPAEIRLSAIKFCNLAMQNTLLPTVARTFPNANIIVTGYFRLFSDKSEPARIYQTVLNVLKLGGIFDVSVRLGKDKMGLMKILSERSEVWYVESNRQLQTAVDAVNSNLTLPGSANFSERNPRVSFVQPPFEAKNAYGASDPWLWELNSQGKSIDDVKDVRREKCEDLKWYNEFICRRASTFHPNQEGARQYAKAIQSKLEVLFPETGWLN